jgi:hypothetical protein
LIVHQGAAAEAQDSEGVRSRIVEVPDLAQVEDRIIPDRHQRRRIIRGQIDVPPPTKLLAIKTGDVDPDDLFGPPYRSGENGVAARPWASAVGRKHKT